MATHTEDFADEVTLEQRATTFATDHLELIENLVKIRKEHGLSQEDVAYRMGISQPSVADFERYDSNPTLARIRRYALAVGAVMRTSVKDACARDSTWSQATRAQTAAAHWTKSSRSIEGSITNISATLRA